MKCIIVIKGVTQFDYEHIRQDLMTQLTSLNMAMPLFCLLPADYSDIEVVWLDEEMEKAMFSESLNRVTNENRPNIPPTQ